MHKQHPQTAYRKYAVLIGTIFENCDNKQGGTAMKWGILATGTIAKKFASTVEQMGAEGEQLVAVGSRHLESARSEEHTSELQSL